MGIARPESKNRLRPTAMIKRILSFCLPYRRHTTSAFAAPDSGKVRGLCTADYLACGAYLAPYLRRASWRLFLIGLLVAISIIAEIFNPIVAGWLTDELSAPPDARAGAPALWYALLLCLQGIAYHASFQGASYAAAFVLSQTAVTQMADAHSRLLRTAPHLHAISQTGAALVISRRGIAAVQTLFQVVAFSLVPTLATAAGLMIAALLESVVVAAIFLIFLIAYTLLATLLSVRYLSPANQHVNRYEDRVGAAFAETLQAIPLIRSFARERDEEARFREQCHSWGLTLRNALVRASVTSFAQSSVNNSFKLCLLVVSVWLWSREIFSPGDVVFVFTSYFVLSGYLTKLGDRIANASRAFDDLANFVGLLNQQEHHAAIDAPSHLNVNEGAVRFENLSFSYPLATGRRQPVLHGVSIDLVPLSTVAIVGESGSGKTTLIRLLQRWYDPDEGRICIDGQNIATVSFNSVRGAVALVEQTPYLLERSVQENITYGRRTATRQEVVKAAQIAHAHEFIVALPQQYDTIIGPGGVELSGGQRQRIAVARAILTDAPILALDEPTSALSPQEEEEVLSALRDAAQGRTTLIITHRRSVLQLADVIFVLRAGRVAEAGSHRTLMELSGGLYRSVYEQWSAEEQQGPS